MLVACACGVTSHFGMIWTEWNVSFSSGFITECSYLTVGMSTVVSCVLLICPMSEEASVTRKQINQAVNLPPFVCLCSNYVSCVSPTRWPWVVSFQSISQGRSLCDNIYSRERRERVPKGRSRTRETNDKVHLMHGKERSSA